MNVCLSARLPCSAQALPVSHPVRHLYPGEGIPQSLHAVRRRGSWTLVSALQSPKGFGPGKEQPGRKKSPAEFERKEEGKGQKQEEEEDDDVVPEVVTNRMMKRIGFTVGLPLGVGILGFPLYYYLKVEQKIDVPEWLPLLTSMFTFGTAGLGITYGILSTSWDPMREGSLLGWKEAQVNWPVFWETVGGKDSKK